MAGSANAVLYVCIYVYIYTYIQDLKLAALRLEVLARCAGVQCASEVRLCGLKHRRWARTGLGTSRANGCRPMECARAVRARRVHDRCGKCGAFGTSSGFGGPIGEDGGVGILLGGWDTGGWEGHGQGLWTGCLPWRCMSRQRTGMFGSRFPACATPVVLGISGAVLWSSWAVVGSSRAVLGLCWGPWGLVAAALCASWAVW